MLIKQQIANLNLVENAQGIGQRDSTYDATVGEIVVLGKSITEQTYTLEPRHIVWIVSKEKFALPDNVTGLATLRTTWTHSGVLALNVGVVDPGWHGPLGTILVNFSNVDFHIKKGEPFLRLLFLEHQSTGAKDVERDQPKYLRDIEQNSKLFSKTFLNMEALSDEVAKKIFALPKFVVILTFGAILIGALSIFAPIAWGVWSGYVNNNAQVSNLTAELSLLKEQVKALEDQQKLKPPANSHGKAK